MQFQADILGCEVERPVIHETTALGAAALAGIATGVWKNQTEFLKHRKVDRVFKPRMHRKEREAYYTARAAVTEQKKTCRNSRVVTSGLS